jgi:hypothetical protein
VTSSAITEKFIRETKGRRVLVKKVSELVANWRAITTLQAIKSRLIVFCGENPRLKSREVNVGIYWCVC